MLGLLALGEAAVEGAVEAVGEDAAEAAGEAAARDAAIKRAIAEPLQRRNWAAEAAAKGSREALIGEVRVGRITEATATERRTRYLSELRAQRTYLPNDVRDIRTAVDATVDWRPIMEQGMVAIDTGAEIPRASIQAARRVIADVTRLGPEGATANERALANRVWREARLYGDNPPPPEVRAARALTRRAARRETEGTTREDRGRAQQAWTNWLRERHGGLPNP